MGRRRQLLVVRRGGHSVVLFQLLLLLSLSSSLSLVKSVDASLATGQTEPNSHNNNGHHNKQRSSISIVGHGQDDYNDKTIEVSDEEKRTNLRSKNTTNAISELKEKCGCYLSTTSWELDINENETCINCTFFTPPSSTSLGSIRIVSNTNSTSSGGLFVSFVNCIFVRTSVSITNILNQTHNNKSRSVTKGIYVSFDRCEFSNVTSNDTAMINVQIDNDDDDSIRVGYFFFSLRNSLLTDSRVGLSLSVNGVKDSFDAVTTDSPPSTTKTLSLSASLISIFNTTFKGNQVAFRVVESSLGLSIINSTFSNNINADVSVVSDHNYYYELEKYFLSAAIAISSISSSKGVSILSSTFDNNAIPNGFGAAVSVFRSKKRVLSLVTIDDCAFRSNVVIGPVVNIDSELFNGGGALYTEAIYTVITNSVFEDNFSAQFGGALLFTWSNSTRIIDCTFERNVGALGGAIGFVQTGRFGEVLETSTQQQRSDNDFGYDKSDDDDDDDSNESHVIHGNFVENCTFSHNVATNKGGAVFIAQAIASFTHIQFLNNSAFCGGAIALDDPMYSYALRSTSAYITTSIFSHNAAEFSGGSIYFTTGYLYISDAELFSSMAEYGASFYVTTPAKLEVHNTRVTLCSSFICLNKTSFGNGLLLLDGEATFFSCQFHSEGGDSSPNTAVTVSGGFFNCYESVLIIAKQSL